MRVKYNAQEQGTAVAGLIKGHDIGAVDHLEAHGPGPQVQAHPAISQEDGLQGITPCVFHGIIRNYLSEAPRGSWAEEVRVFPPASIALLHSIQFDQDNVIRSNGDFPAK
jgi:hypothetical protein